MWQVWISFIISLILFIVGLVQHVNIIYWLGFLIVAILTLWAALVKK